MRVLSLLRICGRGRGVGSGRQKCAGAGKQNAAGRIRWRKGQPGAPATKSASRAARSHTICLAPRLPATHGKQAAEQAGAWVMRGEHEQLRGSGLPGPRVTPRGSSGRCSHCLNGRIRARPAHRQRPQVGAAAGRAGHRAKPQARGLAGRCRMVQGFQGCWGALRLRIAARCSVVAVKEGRSSGVKKEGPGCTGQRYRCARTAQRMLGWARARATKGGGKRQCDLFGVVGGGGRRGGGARRAQREPPPHGWQWYSCKAGGASGRSMCLTVLGFATLW